MKTITNIVYNFVRKQLAKNNMGQGKGITSLPNSMDIEIGMTDIYNKLRKGGFDAVSAGKTIKSEDDLARTLAEINALDRDKKLMKEFQQQLNQDPNRLDIIIDKMNKGIPLNKGDQFALEGSGFETKLDAFKGFEPKVIQGGKSEKELLEKMNKQNKEAVERIKKRKDTDPDKKAEGGRTSYFKGGVINAIKNLLKKSKPKKSGDKIYGVGGEEIDVADFKKSLGLDEATDKKSMEDLEKKLQMIIGRDRTKHAEGGLTRLGFANGSPPSKGRRNFLKLMGGLAALPVVGKFFKFAEPASTAVQAAKEAADVPPYFIKLVEKIKLLGDDVTSTRATGERQAVKEYKGYELTESLDTGSLTIKKDGYTSEEYLEYIPGGQYYDETRKKVIKYPDSYEEVTVKPDAEGKMKDVDFGLDSYDDIIEEVETTDFEFLKKQKQKKASGGLAYMLGM